MWRLFIYHHLDADSETLILTKTKKIANLKEQIKDTIFGPPMLVRWHKLVNLNREKQHLVNWKVLK